jgi:hypothetical protein
VNKSWRSAGKPPRAEPQSFIDSGDCLRFLELP